MIHLRSVNDNLHEARADIEKLKNHIASATSNPQHYVDIFIDLKNKNQISGANSDIYFWIKKPAKDLIDFIEEKSRNTSKSKNKKNLKLAGSRFICDNDEWLIYSITSHDACRYYGRNTKWCITEESDFYWRKYLLQGYRFYFCLRKSPKYDSFDKIALQCKGRRIYKAWDSIDICYSIDTLSFLNLPDISYELKISNQSKKLAKGLIQSPQNILRINKVFLDKDINIPNSVAAIPHQGFAESKVAHIIFEDNTSLKTLNSGTFFNCSRLETVDLPEGLKNLDRGVFHSCDKLSDIILPNSLTEIGPYCFTGCSSLEDIDIPSNVRYIDEGAFKDCIKLSNLTVLSKDIVINNSAFDNCPQLTIYASEKSKAYAFATDHNIDFKPLADIPI